MERFANPRLIDVLGLDLKQEEVDFAIPRLHQDIPLYIDPFLLWISERAEFQVLHTRIVEFFRLVSQLVRDGKHEAAARLLAGCEEPRAMGLGYSSGNRRGSNIGPKLISAIISMHESVPQLRDGQIRHMEELQLVIPNLAEDRISDTASAIIKDFFIEYTASRCKELRIPTRLARLDNVYDSTRQQWVPAAEVALPYNPVDSGPILFAPLAILRRLPWINYPNYYNSSFASRVLGPDRAPKRVAKEAVLELNARNYVEVERYVTEREKLGDRCKPDPLFQSLAPATLRTKFRELRALPPGKSGGADRRFEDLAYDLLSSLLYPTLEFAESRVRTISGAHIRDLIFYNDGKTEFWRDLKQRYDARQPVFELKNVGALETEHVNQLFRYLDDEFGRFGILVTRNPAPKPIERNTVDLHSSKRATVLCLDDSDIELMISVMDSGRDPSDVIKKKFVEFTRLLPK